MLISVAILSYVRSCHCELRPCHLRVSGWGMVRSGHGHITLNTFLQGLGNTVLWIVKTSPKYFSPDGTITWQLELFAHSLSLKLDFACYIGSVIGWQLMFIDSLVHWLRCGFLLEMVPWASFVFETWSKWNYTWWFNNSRSHSNCHVTWATKVLMWALSNLWWSILGKWGQLWMPPAQYVTQPGCKKLAC